MAGNPNSSACQAFFGFTPSSLPSTVLGGLPCRVGLLEQRVGSLLPDHQLVLQLAGDVATFQTSLTDVQNDVSDVQADIASLQVSEAAQNAAISALQASDVTQNGQIAALQASDTTQNSQILQLQADVAAIEAGEPGQGLILAALIASDILHTAQIGSLQTNDSAQDGQIAALQVSDTNQDAQIATLQSSDAQQNADIAALQASDASQNTQITALQNADMVQAGQISALQASDATQNGQIAAIQAVNTTQSGQISALQASDTTQNGQIAALQTSDTAQNAQIATLQASDSTQNSQIAALQAQDLAHDAHLAVHDGQIASLQASDAVQNNAILMLSTSDTTQNTAIASLQASDASQNTAIASLQASDATQNAAIVALSTSDTNQNLAIVALQASDTAQNAAIATLFTNDNAQNLAIVALQGSDVSQNAAILALQTSDANQNTAIFNLQTSDAAQNASIAALQANDTTQDAAILALQTNDTTQDAAILALQTNDAAQDAAILSLQGADVVFAGQIAALQTSDTTQNGQIASLQTATASLSALAVNGYVVRTGANTYTTRTFQNGQGVNVTNADGTAGNTSFNFNSFTAPTGFPVFGGQTTIANALAQLDTTLYPIAGIGNGIVVKVGTNTFTNRSIAAGTNIAVTNGNGVAGNPTVRFATSLTPSTTPAGFGYYAPRANSQVNVGLPPLVYYPTTSQYEPISAINFTNALSAQEIHAQFGLFAGTNLFTWEQIGATVNIGATQWGTTAGQPLAPLTRSVIHTSVGPTALDWVRPDASIMCNILTSPGGGILLSTCQIRLLSLGNYGYTGSALGVQHEVMSVDGQGIIRTISGMDTYGDINLYAGAQVNTISTLSSKRADSIQPLTDYLSGVGNTDAISVVSSIEPIAYLYKTDEADRPSKRYGFLADDINAKGAAYAPLCARKRDSDELLGVNPDSINAVGFAALRELIAKVRDLATRLELDFDSLGI